MIKAAVVGTRYWGKTSFACSTRCLKEMPETHLFACCDACESRFWQVRESYPDIRLFKSVETMVGDDELEAVAITTASPTHFEV